MHNLDETLQPIFKLKGSLFTLTIMQILRNDMAEFTKQLAELIKKSANFLQHAPIVIDLSELGDDIDTFDLSAVGAELRTQGLIPVGVRGVSDRFKDKVIASGMALLANHGGHMDDGKFHNQNTKGSTGKSAKTTTTTTNVKSSKSKLITQSVRSGQQVYAEGGDLIILGSVSPGAEILADGHIHVYGYLRGRVLAGVMGDISARIFCKSLEAELISVAGRYLVSENIQQFKKSQHPMQIYLENDQLKITAV